MQIVSRGEQNGAINIPNTTNSFRRVLRLSDRHNNGHCTPSPPHPDCRRSANLAGPEAEMGRRGEICLFSGKAEGQPGLPLKMPPGYWE